MNENLFSTTQFGNHYDVNQIKKIEIIRGPGSSVYGGYAELGVINIVTKSGKDLNGVSVAGTYGQYDNTYARRNLSLALGDEVGDFEYSVSGFVGQGQRSNATYTDVYGNSRSMIGNSSLDPSSVNVGMRYKKLSTRIIYDNYKNTTIALFDALLPDTNATLNFNSLNTELKYELAVRDKLVITPKINFISQTPWKSASDEKAEFYQNNGFYYNTSTNKTSGGLNASYDITNNINLIAGTEYFVENATANNNPSGDYFLNGKNTISFNTFSAYAQGLLKHKIANVTVGARTISHNQFGNAFAPRVGITKVINNFHTKLLYSNAFRAPGIENINFNPNISPEKTRVLELELGYKLNEKMFITSNVFDINISDPIVYYFDETSSTGVYGNFNKSGSRGVEVEYKVKDSWGFVNVNYSLYSTAGKNDVDVYVVEGRKDVVVGIPQSKLNLYSSVKLTQDLSVNPSFTYMSKRYAYASLDADGVPQLSSYDPLAIVNLNLSYDNFLTDGLRISFGVFDITNQQMNHIQAYNGYSSPLPGRGREFVLKLNYALNFKG